MLQVVSYIAASDGRARVIDLVLNASAALAAVDARLSKAASATTGPPFLSLGCWAFQM